METKSAGCLGQPDSRQRFSEIQKKMAEREAVYLSFGYDIEKERNRILEAAEPMRGEILEAGTGKGYFSLALAKRGHRFTTFDVSGAEQEIARLHLQHHALDRLASFVVENGESLSFKDGSFGTILSVNTLHHLENPVKVMDELIRVLAPSGKLFLCDFNRRGFQMMEKIHAREGNVHGSGKIRLSKAGLHLRDKGFKIRKESSAFHAILIAEKES